MKKEKRTLTLNEWIWLILGSAVILGSIVRLLPGVLAGFPLNDGGMFLSMVKDLQTSHYVLPKFTTYNYLNIPFAYPPFGFYFARAVSDILSIPELALFRWVPVLVNSFSIFVFYLLASEIAKSKLAGAISSVLYALTPGAFGWFIMGGGLTRSFGSLFLLLTVYSTLKLFREDEKKYIGLSILFGGLTVTSHPEAGIHAAIGCVLVWVFFGRTNKSLLQAIAIGLGVFLFISPWLASVLNYHGVAPILSALHTGSSGNNFIGSIYDLLFDEGIIPILFLFRITGLIWGVSKKHYFLLVWSFLPYLVEPRSAPSVSFYPMTILTALAFIEALPWLLGRIKKQEIQNLHQNVIFNIFLLTVISLLFIDSCLYGFRLVGNSLKPNDLETMYWVKENLPENSVFMVLTGIPSPEIDPYVEWFPALAERQNISTLQGYEWLLADKFYNFYTELSKLQQCRSVDCIEKWNTTNSQRYDYVVIFRTEAVEIDELLLKNSSYEKVYSNSNALIVKYDESSTK